MSSEDLLAQTKKAKKPVYIVLEDGIYEVKDGKITENKIADKDAKILEIKAQFEQGALVLVALADDQAVQYQTYEQKDVAQGLAQLKKYAQKTYEIAHSGLLPTTSEALPNLKSGVESSASAPLETAYPVLSRRPRIRTRPC